MVCFLSLHLLHQTYTSSIGIIGTGLFLGTASALQSGGPVGMLLGYIVVGSLCYTVMVSYLEFCKRAY